MAKLIKITGYLVADDSVDEREIQTAAREILSSKFDCIGQSFTTESVALGSDLFYDEDWNNHPLNKMDCSAETCESYFTKG